MRRDGEATRRRLLGAALELYTSVGFRATTTPAIAARAGVAEGTIYRHFSGKESLLNEAYREAQRWGAGLVVDTGGEPHPAAEEWLGRIAARLMEAAAQDPPLVRMLLRHRDDQHLEERSREASREFRAALQKVVTEARADGALRNGPPELWTEVWLALVAFVAERVSTGEWTPEGSSVSLTLAAAWDSIAARPTGSAVP
ncbi:MAG TPA: TetR/AcrR family transcriptional regulator [Gemmatimonadales bacterium]